MRFYFVRGSAFERRSAGLQPCYTADFKGSGDETRPCRGQACSAPHVQFSVCPVAQLCLRTGAPLFNRHDAHLRLVPHTAGKAVPLLTGSSRLVMQLVAADRSRALVVNFTSLYRSFFSVVSTPVCVRVVIFGWMFRETHKGTC